MSNLLVALPAHTILNSSGVTIGEISMRADQNPTAAYIADHTRELALLAENGRLETLAYLLTVAEMEARNLAAPKVIEQKAA